MIYVPTTILGYSCSQTLVQVPLEVAGSVVVVFFVFFHELVLFDPGKSLLVI